ncbi:endonuclease/exonuclease/phosphatase family protein [Noviherbaspirillum pedocola]|uniref:Endonuclease/exonuclease/phosphatase family protein n=1 Tax=Noviherbaspirillum pedocola TaxID=2801341 RepID=A0A934W9B9_9BURK|nr:endonuclease/exonuclease/phosphatase family protein [Noviherbaspirillum pedocola]MBK4736854.1 endonuclease/exonuclease/phosphatase family protein [Noviherbaspirillum pedocola]
MQLITWNIQWGRGCDGRVDLQRIVDEARKLADFDVLCLQEVADNFPALDGSSGEDQFRMLAELLPGYLAFNGYGIDLPALDGSRKRFGNMILSRLPVRQVFRHSLPAPADASTQTMGRMLLEAVIEAPFGLVRVMTTHLEYYSAAQRTAQVEAVRAIQAEACAQSRHFFPFDTSEGTFQSLPRPASAILTADFNYKPSDALHRHMQLPFGDGAQPFIDAWESRWPGVPHPPTLGVWDREQWPEAYTSDFIYVTRDLAPRIVDVKVDGQIKASDHQPVMIRLE